jgi:hypothetical protein
LPDYDCRPDKPMSAGGEVLRAEFDDLAPPDCVFVLSQLLWAFHEITDRSLKGAKEELQ